MSVKNIFGIIVMASMLSACAVALPSSTNQQEEVIFDATPEEALEVDITPTQPDEPPLFNVIERSLLIDSQVPPYEIRAVWPNLDGELEITNPFNAEMDRRVNSAVETFLDQVQGEDLTDEERPTSWLTLDYELTFLSDRLVSVYLVLDTYIAYSAHPFPSSQAMNFDAVSGVWIALADLFLPVTDLQVVIQDEVEQELRERDLGYGEGTIESILQARENWNLMPEGLRFNFDVYEAGPYAAGPQYVLIPWETLLPHLDSGTQVEIFLER